MQAERGPTMEQTLSFIRKGGPAETKNLAKQHLENLLYMKSVLYLDDKNNEKHLSRVSSTLALIKKEFNKEIAEADLSEGNIYLVAQILAANKILDNAILRLKGFIDRVAPEAKVFKESTQSGQALESSQAHREKAVERESKLSAAQVKETPKLRETLSFLLSIIGDPLRVNNKVPLHLSNLEKISKLVRRKYQDPKIQKLNENITAVLIKIYGTNNEKEVNRMLNNSIKILKNLPQYKRLLAEFETQIKNFMLTPSHSEKSSEDPYFIKQPRDQAEKFYKNFKDENNVIKKIAMLEQVLTGQAFKYNKELNAASLKFLKGLEVLGLQLEYPQLSAEKNNQP
jgi:hypothetical protein